MLDRAQYSSLGLLALSNRNW